MSTTPDAVVIGAGIAGLSVAAELARTRSVAVLEMEPAPATHTTGRSAAVYIERYGGPAITPFNIAGRAWFDTRGEGVAEHDLITPRGMLTYGPPGRLLTLGDDPEPGAVVISGDEAVARFPALRREVVGNAVFAPRAADLDPAGAVAVYRRLLRERGATIVTSAPVTALARHEGAWHVETPAGTWTAALVVNAAGAWADRVAALAGLPPVGLQPLRRTIATFAVAPGMGHAGWPLLIDEHETYYLKPETGRMLASPADETPDVPRDARPEMLDVATALERVRDATTLDPRSVLTTWAGLRTFAPDRGLVLGPDPLERTFAWCAGQGGFGIQCSPAAARAVVSLIDAGSLPDDIRALGGDEALVRPDRFTGRLA